MKFDKYSRTARIYPSIIILIPFLLFTIHCNIDRLKELFDDILKAKVIGNITISIVLLYFLIQLNRFIGKYLFEKNLFEHEHQMPTTNFILLHDTQFSKDYKIRIRKKIEKDFKIKLPKEHEELQDIKNARRRIVEANGLVRQKVKNGRLLLQHNIEYGFARNLIGGSIIGILMSIIDLIYFYVQSNSLLTAISIGLTLFFAFLLALHRLIIKYLGNQYAKRLFQEYLQK